MGLERCHFGDNRDVLTQVERDYSDVVNGLPVNYHISYHTQVASSFRSLARAYKYKTSYVALSTANSRTLRIQFVGISTLFYSVLL